MGTSVANFVSNFGLGKFRHDTPIVASFVRGRYRRPKLLGRAGCGLSTFGPCVLRLSLTRPLSSPLLNMPWCSFTYYNVLTSTGIASGTARQHGCTNIFFTRSARELFHCTVKIVVGPCYPTKLTDCLARALQMLPLPMIRSITCP